MRVSEGVKRAGRFAGVLVGVALLAACSKNPQAANGYGVGGSGSGNTYGIGSEGPVTPGSLRDFSVNVGDRVFFETDSVQLTADAQETLRGQAGWLREHPQYAVMIEGHADERGTREYNIGLGAQRANVVRSYLAEQGVTSARVRTLSYGKERPVATCDDISCWSQNRRAVTVLQGRAGS